MFFFQFEKRVYLNYVLCNALLQLLAYKLSSLSVRLGGRSILHYIYIYIKIERENNISAVVFLALDTRWGLWCLLQTSTAIA